MQTNKHINLLTNISREKSLFFENFFVWSDYKFERSDIGKYWFMDESLISIYGTNEYENLSDYEKKKLSYLEACQIIYTYAASEGVFCLFLARALLEYKIGSAEYDFILREQIEEYRHQDMFSRTLKILESEHSEIGKTWKYTMKFEALNVFPKYFYILQVVIEIISGDFGGKCVNNKEVFKLVRDISKIHDIEESRHIAFAQLMLDKYFEKSGFFGRTLGGWFIFFDILFINHHYLKLNNFKKLGLKEYKKVYKISIKNWKTNKLKNFNSKRGMDFINRYGFITWGNRWAFKIFLGFKL